ncbi:hypothetical protein ACLOAU_14735 [Niabella sp. CJ426]|uniref:hypothetical protein n=1 Tax=Niabella sp. CJ426 TaxID=3393740 RepID=UPI003CFC9866
MEKFSTPIPPGADLWKLRDEIANLVAVKWLGRPRLKKEIIWVTKLREGNHYITLKGVQLGNLIEVDDQIIFEPNQPGYTHHGIKK